jgi:hypothetical protein
MTKKADISGKQTINIYNRAWKALAFDNPAIVPFVPLMAGGNTERMLHKCADRIRQEP